MEFKAWKNAIRREKVLSYLKKKKLRSYVKRVSYKCRKDVADSRIRFHGRFVNLTQAKSILAIPKATDLTI